MSFIKKSISAFGKLISVVILAAAFLAGMVGVVYMSLQGNEVSVPEIVGKDFVQSERDLAALGLRIKKRADRYSTEKENTILEQLPRPGETVKTGQMILVVTSKINPEGEETPTTIKKGNTAVEDDSDKIEEMISDKPKKKSNSNSNTNKKKGSTTRDIIKDNSNTASNTSPDNKTPSNSNKNSNDDKNPTNKPPSNQSNSNKTTPSKTPNGIDRPRRSP